jgi:tRNA 2-selenouridine synthase
MSISKINIQEFIHLSPSVPILDVRSPGEYEHAHIPTALSLALFTNAERKIIGTAYKQESREKAIKIGLEYFGKNMVQMVEAVEKIIADRTLSSREVAVHCWRGGMRSAAVAWLLDLYGFKVYLLVGGYKAYRHWVLQQFEYNYQLRIVSGYTGSNKTGIIHEMKRQNENVIDLEQLALHKGSAFGNLGMETQPSQEHFENLLASKLYSFRSDNEKPIWIEDESQRIGNVNIPLSFFKKMREQAILFIDIPFEQRLKHLVSEYGKFEKEKLINAIIRIKKKLGGLETKTAVNFLLEDDVENCFMVLLNYYDRQYLKSTKKRENFENTVSTIPCDDTRANLNTQKLIEHVRN